MPWKQGKGSTPRDSSLPPQGHGNLSTSAGHPEKGDDIGWTIPRGIDAKIKNLAITHRMAGFRGELGETLSQLAYCLAASFLSILKAESRYRLSAAYLRR